MKGHKILVVLCFGKSNIKFTFTIHSGVV
jgi:hypothetical protein